MMKHGGNIKQAAEQFGFQPSEMIDLSTGISPRAYPFDLTMLSVDDLIDLPQGEDEQKLINIMHESWSVPDSINIALSPGSGLMISLLPRLYRDHYAKGRNTVLCPCPVYGEHIEAWRDAGFDAKFYPVDDIPQIDDDTAAIIGVQPGNPIGNIHPAEDWSVLLDEASAKSVMVVMDEAFIDLQPEASLIPHLGRRGQVVIRSLGKFYGLAGVRLGAAVGHFDDMAILSRMMGPWPVSSLALSVAATAIRDHDWADDQRGWLSQQMKMMTSGFNTRGIEIIGATDLYCLISIVDAARLQGHLAQAGFWTRIFDDEPTWMRVGLPADDSIIKKFFEAFDQY